MNILLIMYQYKIYILLGLVIAILGIYNLYQIIVKKRQRNREFEEKLMKESLYVDKFLDFNLKFFIYSDLKSKIKEIENKSFIREYPQLKLKIKEAKNVLVELKHKEIVNHLESNKNQIKAEIKELKLEKEKLRRTEEERKLLIKNKLNIYENYVFDKSLLRDEEIQILLEEKYRQVNQYCVKQQKVITVLIKPPMRHSITHAFLVWSVKNLLEEYGVVENIKEHETKTADITFEAWGNDFAIEIETGSLLSKEDQLRRKINFLNRRYRNRWLIVASNRELVAKYKEFGNCVQRKGVRKKIEKMLKIRHP